MVVIQRSFANIIGLTSLVFAIFMKIPNTEQQSLDTYDNGFLDILNISKSNWNKNEIVFALNLPVTFCDHCYDKYSGTGYNYPVFFAPAAAVAVEDVNKQKNLLSGYKLRYAWNKNIMDTHCEELTAVRRQFKQINMGVHAFIGYACECRAVATNAAAMNLPLISMSCSEAELSDKKIYPTFARTTELNADIIHMIMAVMKHFKWQKMAVLYEKSHMWKPVYKALKKYISDKKIQHQFDITEAEEYGSSQASQVRYESLHHVFNPFLKSLEKKARIVWLMLDKAYLRQFLLLAEELGYTKGEYVFIALHPFAPNFKLLRKKNAHNYMWIIPWTADQKTGNDPFYVNRAQLARAFQSLLVLMPAHPETTNTSYQSFRKRVNRGMFRPPFDAITKDSPFAQEDNENDRTANTTRTTRVSKMTAKPKQLSEPPPEAYRLYDSVILYALALNKTISKKQNITNGTAIIENMKGLEFNGKEGSHYIVNSNGEVQVYFHLYQFQFTDLDIQKISKPSFFKTKEQLFVPKKVFSMETNCANLSCSNLVYHLNPTNLSVVWKLGKTPADRPKCGFYNELCRKSTITKGTLVGLVISVTMIIVFMFIIMVFLYRNYRLKRTLKSQLWKIDPSDLFFHDWRSVSTSSLGSLTSQTLSVNCDIGTRQRFTTVAIYKGTLVAVKKINKRSIELNKSVLIELKQIRDVRHDNLNQFVGACVESNNILVITQYASKGSLQDVLENTEIRLNTLFILSLVHDIIKGMCYLHSTDIKSHGNLKSSNCVIDSRWVLKITDFGLNMFRSKQGTLNSVDIEPFNNLLWKAPELLRLNIPATSRGSQKGDVYSFAIILQECHTRDGAWGSSYQDPEAIIERVKTHSDPPFRPVVSDLLDGAEGLRDIMKHCWADNPEERPHFSDLRKDVEVMMKANGLKTNIFDNMVYMMGKYSDDLEEMVEERTSSLIEEKHKVEALLERMLPKSVARQLMKGKAVEAESFEEVTIYFSDIVGFTTICSSISPMEVVNLLNSLYTMFDNVTKEYDVYKVETIGDAYMVVSGLPIRNGKQHAKEISLLALDILENVKTLQIKPNQTELRIRIGIHSGPVVAGVVGTAMPRYCLFGDTVNVASRMESTGNALRIHVSSSVKDVLTMLGGFTCEPRGLIDVKGKGELETFWLLGAAPHLIRRRTTQNKDSYHQNNVPHTLKDLLRDSPRLRHKLVLTPDYLPCAQTVSASDHLSKKFCHNGLPSTNGRLQFNKFRKSSERRTKEKHELIDFTDNEMSNLLERTRNGTINSLPSGHYENGALNM